MFSVFAKLGWFFKEEWRRYTIAIMLLLIVNVLEMLPQRYLGQAVDDIRSGQFVSIGALYAFVDYLNRLFQPITGIVNQFSRLELARVSSERVFRLLNEPRTEMEELVQKKIEGHVQFQDVTFAYNEGKNVLKNFTFESKKGQTVASS